MPETRDPHAESHQGTATTVMGPPEGLGRPPAYRGAAQPDVGQHVVVELMDAGLTDGTAEACFSGP